MGEQFRLNKFLAERLGLSRREADGAISAGLVTIDGSPAQLGARIDKNSKVCYNNKIVPFQADFLYYLFNKPAGYVCSRRAQGAAPTLYDLLPESFRQLKTVGRLDKDSSGLIILTNDGDFAHQMTHPKFRKTKVYEVKLDHPLAPLHQQMISDHGIMLDDGPSRFKVIRCDENAQPQPQSQSQPQSSVSPLYIAILTEGRNRQIRRTFAALGYIVTGLHRTSFGKYELGDLKPGEYAIIKP